MSATYHAMSLTHYVDGDDDDERDFHVNDDALNVRLVILLVNRSTQPVSIDMDHVHSYRLYSKTLHFARLSTQILIIIAMQLYWIQPILTLISVLIASSFYLIFLLLFMPYYLKNSRKTCQDLKSLLLRLAVEFRIESISFFILRLCTTIFLLRRIRFSLKSYAQIYRWNGTLAVVCSDVD